jgi:hypothetical protein
LNQVVAELVMRLVAKFVAAAMLTKTLALCLTWTRMQARTDRFAQVENQRLAARARLARFSAA